MPSFKPNRMVREECPVKRAVLTLHMEDGRTLEWEAVEPDAARLSVDTERPDDVMFGLPIEAPLVLPGAGYPYQLTATFGFRWGRHDKFLTLTEAQAEASSDAPGCGAEGQQRQRG